MVGRLGGNWYSRIQFNTMFEVAGPPADCVGFNGLPEHIRQSHVLTGNDLAKLANSQTMPKDDTIKQYAKENNLFDDAVTELHEKAQQHLRRGDVDQAWLTLLAK